jgi:hypothetical protein
MRKTKKSSLTSTIAYKSDTGAEGVVRSVSTNSRIHRTIAAQREIRATAKVIHE